MKKLMLLAALLAMVVVAAVPAIAQVAQEQEQEVESGDATQNFTVTGGGDNSSQCAGIQGITNTGNATNTTGILQYATEDSDIEVEDSGTFAIGPSQTATCKTAVNQAASASN